MSKRLFFKRSWLNPPSSEDTGHLRSYAHLNDWNNEGVKQYSIDASIAFADCYRKVEFEFSCETKKRAKQRIAKLELMIWHLEKVRDAIRDNMEKLV